ncbi:unnamed protein product [Effrenium voratum]|nr:unnamed protein product [Effrenium voratum]
MSLAGSSCVSLRLGYRPGSVQSVSRSLRSESGMTSNRRAMREESYLALSFDEVFTRSYSRATKRMACERKEGTRPGTMVRDKLQYRSLSRWWTAAELKLAEEAAAASDHASEDGSSSGFGDDQSSRGGRVANAPMAARRKSIEAILAARRNSMAAARKLSASVIPPEVAKEEEKPSKKFKRLKGSPSILDTGEIKDPDLVEILQLPTEQDVRARLADSLEDFSVKDIELLKKAFMKHRQSFSPEIHTDDLQQILDFMGYLKIPASEIQNMVSEITKYSTLELEEFIDFMRLARDYDHRQIRAIFQQFDADGSGELSAEELEMVLKSLGITPFRSTISGALNVVDADESGTLDFPEFVQLLLIYRKTEGFAEPEVLKLNRIFRRFAEPMPGSTGRYIMQYGLSSQALMEMFGSQAAQLAARLDSALPRPSSTQSAEDGEAKAKRKTKQVEGMTFREFLIWARRLREVEVQWYKQEFEKADIDGGGFLDEDEIRRVLKSLGYTPLRAVIFDLFEIVQPHKGNLMDFDEFVEMMEVFRGSNGFMRHEVKEFQESFNMYDTAKSGEVDVIQVGGILRSLGFSSELAQVQVLVKTVDWNGSNSLDFNEFLRLMRLHREEELLSVRQVFDKHAETNVTEAGEIKTTIEPKDAKEVLFRLGYPESVAKSTSDLFSGLMRAPLDYDALVLLVDSCRRMNMNKMRKQAGFTDDAVAKFSKLFRSLDDDDSGEIAQNELVIFCRDRGLPLATKRDQQQLLSFINDARRMALQSGVPRAECGPDNSAAVTLWVFIHLQRILQTHQDKLRAEELRGSGPNSFSQHEVDELSALFLAGVQAEKGKSGDPKATLSINGLWTILAQLDVTLTPIEREEVKMKLFMDCGNQLDLPGFLRVVGWLAAAKQSSADLRVKR